MLWWQQLHSFWASVLLKSAHVHCAASFDCDADCSVTLCVFLGVQECMGVTRPFAAGNVNQTNSTALGAAFLRLCNQDDVLKSTSRCNQVHETIAMSFQGNAGKRAAGLCSALQLCTSSLSSNCLVDVATMLSTVVQVAAPSLDNCTITGQPGGSLVPVGVPTLAPLPKGKCTSASQCGDPEHFTCSANKGTACACSPEGQETCVELAECSQTPEGACSSCVAGMLNFTRQFAADTATASTNSTAVGERWATFCASSGYDTSICGNIRAQITNSVAGSLGKQAGMLCRLLGRCSPANITANCPIITQLFSGIQVRQTLDLCTMEGVPGGSRVPGVSASAAIAPGRCLNTTDCKSDTLECNMNNAVTIYTCSQGVLSSTTQGTCVKTACQVCRDCMAATQPFAIGQATISNGSRVAEEWLTYCQRNNMAGGAKCAEVATRISTEGAMPGNLGKRAAGLCFALGQCNTSSCGSTLRLDRCTVQGLTALEAGMAVPGVSATQDVLLGRCFTASDCTAPANTCDKSAASKLCTCSNGQDTCLGDTVGSCSIAGGGCSDCKQCLAAVQPFIKQALQDSTAVNTWVQSCTTAQLGTSGVCAAVGTSFGTDINKYRRAGQLCQALQRCSQSLAASAACTLPGITLGTGGTSSTQARLDFCSAEGVTGGSVIPGISSTKTLPSGKCQNDVQCGSASLRCDTSNTTAFCYCEGGSDLCLLSVGNCVRTSCAICNDCLDSANKLTEATKFLQDNATVVGKFDNWCSTPSLQPWAPSKCSGIRSLITANMNVAKRAGLLCQNLDACNPSTLPATCRLASRNSTTVLVKGGQLVRALVLSLLVARVVAPALSKPTVITNWHVSLSLDYLLSLLACCCHFVLQDKCTVEGVSDGDLPPGVRAAGFKPLGTCFNSSDCSTGYDCKTTDGKLICSCDAATGKDTCVAIGSCVMQSCKACEVCVQAMQLFPDIVKDETRADTVADKFRSFCAGTGRSPVVCEATAAAVAASAAGNLGRRVGALCGSLAECPAQTPPCNVTIAAGQSSKPLDNCTIKGVAGEAPEGVASGAKPPNSCRPDDGCAEAGFFCSMANPTRVCTCASSTGDVSCQMFGTCDKTPCRICSDCISGLQDYVNSTLDANSTTVAATFQATCVNQGNAPPICAASAAYIQSSNKGNLGRRAGALCSMLGELHMHTCERHRCF